MGIITVSRGSFSYGKEVAEKVAERLGYDIISREQLIEASSKEFDVPQVKLLQAIKDAPSFLDKLTYGKERYIAYIESALLSLLAKDNVVYHGFAGHFFVRDIPHILKVRVIADMEKRIEFVMKRDKVSREKAIEIIKTLDEIRSKWSRHLYGIDSRDMSLYDLMLNIKQLTVEDAVEIVCQYMSFDSFKTTPEVLKTLKERAIAAKVRGVVMNIKPDIEVTFKDGVAYIKTSLFPQMEDRFVMEARRACREIPEVKSVRFDIYPLVYE